MTTLFLNPSNSPYRDGFYKELAKLIDVKFLFYFNDAKGGTDFNHQIVRGEIPMIGYNRGFNLLLAWKLLTEKYDTVINSDPCSFAAHIAYPIAKLRGKKYVTWTELWHYPNTILSNIIKPYIKHIIKKSDAVICAGTKSKELMKTLGAKKITIAPNASYDITQLLDFNEKLPKKFILQVGDIRPCEGQLELIKAFKQLKRKDLHLLIVGRMVENHQKYYWDCIKESKDQNIRFEGYVDKQRLRSFYTKCLFLVCPMIKGPKLDPYGSWEMCINEALSASKPIISTTAVAGAYDMIKDNGFIIGHKDPEDMLTIIMKTLLSITPEQLKELGQESRKMYETTFNHKNMAEQFFKVLEAI